MSRVFHYWLYRSAFVMIFTLLPGGCGGDKDPEELFKQGDYAHAFKLWQPRVRAGDPAALNYLGIHYYAGLGVKRDLIKAEQWFRKAAEKAYPDAQYNLGLMYENGHVLPQDFTIAYMWFYAAHTQGNKNASRHMIRLSREHKILPNQMKHAEDMARQYVP